MQRSNSLAKSIVTTLFVPYFQGSTLHSKHKFFVLHNFFSWPRISPKGGPSCSCWSSPRRDLLNLSLPSLPPPPSPLTSLLVFSNVSALEYKDFFRFLIRGKYIILHYHMANLPWSVELSQL